MAVFLLAGCSDEPCTRFGGPKPVGDEWAEVKAALPAGAVVCKSDKLGSNPVLFVDHKGKLHETLLAYVGSFEGKGHKRVEQKESSMDFEVSGKRYHVMLEEHAAEHTKGLTTVMILAPSR
jgi:hypothetical protein